MPRAQQWFCVLSQKTVPAGTASRQLALVPLGVSRSQILPHPSHSRLPSGPKLTSFITPSTTMPCHLLLLGLVSPLPAPKLSPSLHSGSPPTFPLREALSPAKMTAPTSAPSLPIVLSCQIKLAFFFSNAYFIFLMEILPT